MTLQCLQRIWDFVKWDPQRNQSRGDLSLKLFHQQSKANASLEFVSELLIFIALNLVEGEITRNLCFIFMCNYVVMLISAIWSAVRAVGFQLNFEMHCTVSISNFSSTRCFMCRIKMAFVMFYCLQIDTMWDTKGLLVMQAYSFHHFIISNPGLTEEMIMHQLTFGRFQW